MDWLAAVEGLRARRVAGVIVTLAVVRGHSPRNAGAKMVVSADDVWGTVGGGNLEATAITQARTMILNHSPEPALVKLALDDKAPVDFGVQCCGGEITMLLEPVPVVPSVAIFGMGHVGVELARILSRHDLELFMIDSRADMLTDDRLAGLADGSARLHVRHVAVPESVFPDLPPGTHVMIMTHDHAEDIALCDSALRRPELASIGLIGSEMKWTRFRKRLTAEGHCAQELERGSAGGELEWLINGEIFEPDTLGRSKKNRAGNEPLASQRKGSFGLWELRNGGGGWVHPMHMHQEEHRIVMREDRDVTRSVDPGHPDDASREDTIALDPGESVICFRGFRGFTGPYVAHCHNLAHEDHAMMFGWEIT